MATKSPPGWWDAPSRTSNSPGANIGAIVRGDEVLIAHHDTVIEAEDHLILFLVDKQRTREVERLFQVGVMFL